VRERGLATVFTRRVDTGGESVPRRAGPEPEACGEVGHLTDCRLGPIIRRSPAATAAGTSTTPLPRQAARATPTPSALRSTNPGRPSTLRVALGAARQTRRNHALSNDHPIPAHPGQLDAPSAPAIHRRPASLLRHERLHKLPHGRRLRHHRELPDLRLFAPPQLIRLSGRFPAGNPSSRLRRRVSVPSGTGGPQGPDDSQERTQ
jgi:hypothetical protein